ncbi:MAG: glycosyl transferase [Opitutales bacterium]|nr:glycosyl transferase [Opitutales bacterium]
MKWGTKYGPDYVERLHRAVCKHLTGPFRFICFTDDAVGLPDGVENFPIPPLSLDPNAPERGWKKLTVLSDPLEDITGQVLFLDLDIVITGDLSVFFEYPGDFCIIQDWLLKSQGIGNSSVFRFNAGAHADVLRYFRENQERVKAEVRNEQAFLTRQVRENFDVTFWPPEWCVSFKRSCIPPFPFLYFRSPTLPKGARVVVFHGHPNPPEAIQGKGRGFRRFKPAPWIKEHWA